MEKVYEQLFRNVEKHRERIYAARDFLWKHPETGYKEWKSSEYLAKQFEELGYTLTYAGDIPGFYTDLDTGRPGPTLLLMGELDALRVESHPDADPVTGAVHACGHCVQVTGLLGAAAALKEPGALDGMCGKIRLMAVPAEEGIEIGFREELRQKGTIRYLSGKQEFISRGYLDGVDLDMLIHSSSFTSGTAVVHKGGNGFLIKRATFLGRSAHAAGSPQKGINALYAANLALGAINALRETFLEKDHIRVHPILTKGGTVVNAIPETVVMENYIRGASVEAIRRENEKVNRAVAGAAFAMGANVELTDRPGDLPIVMSPSVRQACFAAAELVLGEGKVSMMEKWAADSSDLGDVTALMPTAYLYLGGATGICHGNDYRVDDAETLCVGSAKILVAYAQLVLGNGAALAKQITADYHPIFKNKEEYCAAMDALILDCKAVEYREDGTASLRIKN